MMHSPSIEGLERRLLFTVVPQAPVRIPPAITSDNSDVFMTGAAGTFTITTTGFPAAKLAETGALPAGLAFHSNGDGTATLFGTPALNAGGVYSLILSASNGVAPNTSQRFTLTVDQSPVFTSANHLTVSTLVAAKFIVAASGYPAATLSETGSLPNGFSLTDNGNGTATLTDLIGGKFTPASLGTGTFTLTFNAANGITPNAQQFFTLTVNQPPQFATANLASFTTDAAGTFAIAASGFPAPAISEKGTLPSGLAFLDNGNGTATLFGTPAHFAGGSFSFQLTATNGIGLAATEKVTLIIDQPAVLTSANHATFITGGQGKFTVSTGGYPAALIDITGTGTLPSGVTLTSNNNGTALLDGVPPVGAGGIFTFTLRANNGVAPTSTQVFTLTIDQPPAFTSLNHTTFTTNTAGTFNVVTGGFPTTMIALTGKLPSGLIFRDNDDGTGTLIGTPSADAGGKYTLGFTAVSPSEGMAAQVFTLTVAEPTSITSANTTTFAAGRPVSFTVTTTGFPLTSISETGPLPNVIGLRDNGNGTASFFGVLHSGTQGTYTLTLTADNHAGSIANQIFTLIVD